MDIKAPVSTVMTNKPQTVQSNDTLERVEQIFQEHSYRHLPVVDDGALVGILSKTDYLKVISITFENPAEQAQNRKRLRALLVKDIMSPTVLCLDAQRPVSDAIQIFKTKKVHALPVTDEGKLVGIVTVFDFLGLAELLMSASDDAQFLGV